MQVEGLDTFRIIELERMFLFSGRITYPTAENPKIMTPPTPRPDEWTFKFLDALRTMPIVSHACDEAGISPTTAYKHRKKNNRFAQEWDEALEKGIDHLEQAAWQAAQDGDRQLLIFLLKALRPAKYHENRRTHSKTDDKIEIVLTRVVAREDEPES